MGLQPQQRRRRPRCPPKAGTRRHYLFTEPQDTAADGTPLPPSQPYHGLDHDRHRRREYLPEAGMTAGRDSGR
jgi:hypothetical protein